MLFLLPVSPEHPLSSPDNTLFQSPSSGQKRPLLYQQTPESTVCNTCHIAVFIGGQCRSSPGRMTDRPGTRRCPECRLRRKIPGNRPSRHQQIFHVRRIQTPVWNSIKFPCFQVAVQTTFGIAGETVDVHRIRITHHRIREFDRPQHILHFQYIRPAQLTA